FAYPDQPEKMILKDISITIPSGAMIGVFGRTGSGKTTLLRLIARSFNPPKGSICIGGLDICTFDLKSWRKKLSFVPQRPFLFSDTIQGNIALEDTFLEKDIERVVSLASLKQDLDAFEKGLDTIVGERGIMLSGGQRQRVALARGLYKENSLILLDDILSAVDHENEARLVSTLNEISQDGNTCFIVSNRVSAFRYASLILVLEQGRLVDSGTHEELIKREGIYQETYHAQREVS
ncbi:MAG: ATP-binding cassette domain-containing protein, partial [Myxococcota bacterium]|nr:ATP-binding cassette domain-containing protein [Myxococcota bacterium]